MKIDYPDKVRYEKCVKDLENLLQQASTIFRLMDRDQVQNHNFTSSQSFLLETLLDNKEMSVNEISKFMNLEKSSVSRIIKVLVRDNLLQKKDSSIDKRVTNISLTKKGKEKAIEIHQGNKEYYNNIISNLPSGHVREVMDSATTFINALAKSR